MVVVASQHICAVHVENAPGQSTPPPLLTGLSAGQARRLHVAPLIAKVSPGPDSLAMFCVGVGVAGTKAGAGVGALCAIDTVAGAGVGAGTGSAAGAGVPAVAAAAASSAVVVALEMSANLTGDGTDESGDVA